MDLIHLSKRLQAVADMVTPGSRPVDVGCDHAYVPIYLVENHIADRVTAMDVHLGPVRRAEKNVEAAGLSRDQVAVRLSLIHISLIRCDTTASSQQSCLQCLEQTGCPGRFLDDFFMGRRNRKLCQLLPCIEIFFDQRTLGVLYFPVINTHMPYPVGKNMTKFLLIF